MKCTGTQWIQQPGALQRGNHSASAVLDVGAQIDQPPGHEQLVEQPREVRLHQRAFLVGSLPPRIGKLQADHRNRARGKQARNLDPGVALDEADVLEPTGGGAPLRFAGELPPAFESDVSDVRKTRCVLERKTSHPRAELELERAVEAKDLAPVGWGRASDELLANGIR